MEYSDAFKRFSTGVQLFVAEDAAAYAKGEPTHGFGILRYDEGSVYYGDVYFDGKDYHKWGFGRQDFLLSELSRWLPEHNARLAFYIGAFDYRCGGWIYGDGVMYYVDENNRPVWFVKGFFECLERIGDYTGAWTPQLLADGYRPDMERIIDQRADKFHNYIRRLSEMEQLENLFIGDSYFEFWNSTEYAGDPLFYDVFPVSRNLNMGIGGTCFEDWLRFLPEVVKLPQPKRIFLNLGFNGLHLRKDPPRVYKAYLKFLQTLKQAFPDAAYYLLNVVQSPTFLACSEWEQQLNALCRDSAEELGVTIVDMRTRMQEHPAQTVFHPDGIHLNKAGYTEMMHQIQHILEK